MWTERWIGTIDYPLFENARYKNVPNKMPAVEEEIKEILDKAVNIPG